MKGGGPGGRGFELVGLLEPRHESTKGAGPQKEVDLHRAREIRWDPLGRLLNSLDSRLAQGKGRDVASASEYSPRSLINEIPPL